MQSWHVSILMLHMSMAEKLWWWGNEIPKLCLKVIKKLDNQTQTKLFTFKIEKKKKEVPNLSLMLVSINKLCYNIRENVFF